MGLLDGLASLNPIANPPFLSFILCNIFYLRAIITLHVLTMLIDCPISTSNRSIRINAVMR